MRLGVLADTHDELARTRRAVALLIEAGAEAVVHCGDLTTPAVLAACAARPCWFAFGNHDADAVPELRRAAAACGAVCLGWGGVADLGGRRVGVTHGHMTADVRRVLAASPDYLLTGHSHLPGETCTSSVRRVNPGALFRADEFTVALIDLAAGAVHWLRVGE